MILRNLMEVSMMHMDRTLPEARWLNRLTGICQVPDCCTKGWYWPISRIDICIRAIR